MKKTLLALICVSGLASAAVPLNIRQSTMLQTLQQVVSIFAEEYAPFDYKSHSYKFDLQEEIKRATAKITENPDITTGAYQDLLSDLVNATRDFHVSIQFHSTERATLPFQVMEAEGRYFISYIERSQLSKVTMPDLDVGTEIVEFDGKPIREAVRELISARIQEPSPAEWRMAESKLTKRERATGMKVPSGEIMLKVKTGDAAQPTSEIPMTWEYRPEFTPEVPIRNMIFTNGAPRLSVNSQLNPRSSPFDVGSPEGYIPELGNPLTGRSGSFQSYIFRSPKGFVAGYARISTFGVDSKANELLEEFGGLMNMFEQKTDALILDLTRNGGGSVGYMYGLLSRLAKRPMQTLQQQIMVSASDAADSAQRVAIMPFISTEEQAASYLSTQGLSAPFTSFAFLQSMLNNDRFILSELKAGRRLTKPTYLLGISRIPGHPTQRYTKPLIVLIDELDFSAADFFPAILQDNHRAVLFGARTAGAGGAVRTTQFPNQFNISALAYTWTIAQRMDGTYLENVGVTPDVPYALKASDLQTGFKGYRKALMELLDAEIAKSR